MWDKDTPLQLLSTMPNILENEHLEKLQMLLEADKYKNQLVSGLDLCGTYAPFCGGCNKENKYPCAIAYINYLRAQGMDIQIDAGSTNEQPEISPEAENISETENISVESESLPEADDTVEVSENSPEDESLPEESENAPEGSQEAVEEVKPDEEPNNTEEQPKKIKIRIAMARKKTI